MATQKEIFVVDFTVHLQALIDEALEYAPSLVASWNSLGYNSGGSDPVVDGDLTNFNGVTAAQLNSAITALGDLANYFNNVAVPTLDRAPIFNDLKNVQLT